MTRDSEFNLARVTLQLIITRTHHLARRDEQTGQLHYSADFSNTYYHLDGNHIVRKNPVFDGDVYLSISSYQTLDAGQHHVISISNVNIVLI